MSCTVIFLQHGYHELCPFQRDEMESPVPCAVCKEPSVGRCPVCKSEYYCSDKCQWIGWNFQDHDDICGEATAQPIEGRHGGYHGGGHHGGGRHHGGGHHQRGSKPHHTYTAEKWRFMARHEAVSPAQARFFYWKASQAK